MSHAYRDYCPRVAMLVGPHAGSQFTPDGGFHLGGIQLMFKCHGYAPLSDFDTMLDVPPEWHSRTVLALGSHKYLSYILPKLRSHEGPFIYATDCVFKDCWQFCVTRRSSRRSSQCISGMRSQPTLKTSILCCCRSNSSPSMSYCCCRTRSFKFVMICSSFVTALTMSTSKTL